MQILFCKMFFFFKDKKLQVIFNKDLHCLSSYYRILKLVEILNYKFIVL